MPLPRLLLVSIRTPWAVRAGLALSVGSGLAGVLIRSSTALWPDGLIANSVAPAIGNHHAFIPTHYGRFSIAKGIGHTCTVLDQGRSSALTGGQVSYPLFNGKRSICPTNPSRPRLE